MALYKDDKRGTWYCVFRINGKMTTKRGYASRKLALQAEIEALEDSNINTMSLTCVAEEYIQHLARHNNSSAYTVESMFRLHISPVVGDRKRITSISIHDIRKIQNEMICTTYGNGHHYANSTVNQATGIFNMIMNYALQYGYIQKNPCANFKSLKEIVTYDTISFWTDEQFMKAIQFESDFMWYSYLVVSYMTGMRKGEVRGLQWRDIDFKANTITINRHIDEKVLKQKIKDMNLDRRVISGRKNGNAHILALDNSLHRILHKLLESEQCLDGWTDKCYVFGGYKPVGQNTPKRHLENIATKANLPFIKVHGLRHSHVSYLISKGLNAYEIAERIGDSVEMVLKVYGHMFPNPQKNVVETLNNNFNFDYNGTKMLSQMLSQVCKT